MPLIWRIPDDYPQSQIGFYDRVLSPDRFIFLEGRRIQEPLKKPRATFDCKKDDLRHRDCIWTDARVPIVNARLKFFLNSKVLDQVQFFDVDIMAEDGDVPGYHLLNPTRIVQVIDIASSKYNLIPGTDAIMSFSTVRVNDSGMGDVSIGRDEAYLSYLFLSDLLAEDFKSAGFRGLSLVEPSSVV